MYRIFLLCIIISFLFVTTDNELSGRLIQERIRRLDIPCSSTMKFYEGTSYVDFDDFERIVKADRNLGYEVFIVDTFSKIKYDKKYNANDYNDTYEVLCNLSKRLVSFC